MSHPVSTCVRALAALGALLAATLALPAQAQPCALCDLPVHSTIEQADLDVAIDVVLVGDGFTDATSWGTTASGVISTFKGSAAGIYGAVPNVFNFHVVDVISATTDVGDNDTSDTALGMKVGGPFITANQGAVNQAALNAPDVDVVVAVANSGSGRANANFPFQLASGGTIRLSRSAGPISHEMGHAAFHLSDEYVESALCQTPGEASLLLEANTTTDPTCFKFAGLSGATCNQGAVYCSSGVFRSASNCLMRSGSTPCPACTREIEDVLLERRTRSDVAPPWAFVDFPSAGAVVAGRVRLSARVHDDFFGPTLVAFEIDGAHVGTVESSGTAASFTFDTRALADGAHTLVAFASDAAGHASDTKPVSFTTANFTDATAPTVTISAPTQGAVVDPNQTFVSARVGGAPQDIDQIMLFIDDVAVAAAVARLDLFFPWDTSGEAVGSSHTLRAVVTDVAQNEASSPPVTVTIGPRSGGEAPRAFIFEPADWSPVGELFTLGFSASGGQGQAVDALLLLDGVPVIPNPLPPPATPGGGGSQGESGGVLIDASSWSLGPHRLVVRASAGGVSADSAPVVVVRQAMTGPVVFLLSPNNGSALRGDVAFELAARSNQPIVRSAVRVDDVEVVASGAGALHLTWNSRTKADGCYPTQAEVRDGAGATARSESFFLCVDNTAPTAEIAAPVDGQQVPPGPTAVHVLARDNTGVGRIEVRVDGALATAQEAFGDATLLVNLSAGARTLTARVVDRAGNAVVSAPVRVTVADCAVVGCNDSDACTGDRCASTGTCIHDPAPGCCDVAADCDDGDACTTDTCSQGSCQHAVVAGCCNHAGDCDDGDACTDDVCSGTGGTCSHPSAGCCNVDGDCNDGTSCTTDRCIGGPDGRCAHDRAPECCAVAADCDDDDLCTTDTCNQGTCAHAEIASCCRTPAECGDGDACTNDFCIEGVCGNAPLPGCCVVAADCATLDPCAVESCTQGRCSQTRAPGCCNFDDECADADACTDDRCVNNTCTNVTSALCCAVAGDCDDGDACTLDTCGADRRCGHAAIAGCGAADAGTVVDAGASGTDAGGAGDDAGAPTGDAGTSTGDAGTSADDGGTAAADGGPSDGDAGATDGGAGGTDAGDVDPGATDDAGSTAKPPEREPPDEALGCTCGAASTPRLGADGLLLVGLLSFLGGVRRRSARRR